MIDASAGFHWRIFFQRMARWPAEGRALNRNFREDGLKHLRKRIIWTEDSCNYVLMIRGRCGVIPNSIYSGGNEKPTTPVNYAMNKSKLLPV